MFRFNEALSQFGLRQANDEMNALLLAYSILKRNGASATTLSDVEVVCCRVARKQLELQVAMGVLSESVLESEDG